MIATPHVHTAWSPPQASCARSSGAAQQHLRRALAIACNCKLGASDIAQHHTMEFSEYESTPGQYHPLSMYTSDIVDPGLNRAVKQQLSKLYTGVSRDENPLKLHYDASQEECLRRNAEAHFNNKTGEINTPPALPGYKIPNMINQTASPFIGGKITDDIFLQFMIFVLIILVIMQYSALVNIEKTLERVIIKTA